MFCMKCIPPFRIPRVVRKCLELHEETDHRSYDKHASKYHFENWIHKTTIPV